MIISTEAEALDKVPYPFIIKTLNVGLERTYLNILKALYEKPRDNIILNNQNKTKLRAFLLRSGTRQGWPLSLLLFIIVPDPCPSCSNQTRKGNRRHLNW